MLISNEAQNYTSGQVLIKTDVNGNIINLMDQSGTTINTPLIDPDTGTLINPTTGAEITISTAADTSMADGYRFALLGQQQAGVPIDATGLNQAAISLGATAAENLVWGRSKNRMRSVSGTNGTGAIRIAPGAAAWDMSIGESLIYARRIRHTWTVNDGVEGQWTTATTGKGFRASSQAPGSYRPALSDGAVSAAVATNTLTVSDGAEHVLVTAVDGMRKLMHTWIDGVLIDTLDVSSVTGSTISDRYFCLGNDGEAVSGTSGNPANTFDAEWSGVHFLVIPAGKGLPGTMADIVAYLTADPARLLTQEHISFSKQANSAGVRIFPRTREGILLLGQSNWRGHDWDAGLLWAPSTAIALGEMRRRVDPALNTGIVQYKCTTAGTTGTTEPTWPATLGQTVSDGTVVWTAETKGLPQYAKAGLPTGDPISPNGIASHPNIGHHGSMWPAVVEALYRHDGTALQIWNSAVGGTGLIADWCGATGSGGTAVVKAAGESGWDPNGYIATMLAGLTNPKLNQSEKVWILTEFGQADSNTNRTAAQFAQGLINVCGYAMSLDNRVHVLLGLSFTQPSTASWYDTAGTPGVAQAYTALSAQYPGRVHMGANLHALLGNRQRYIDSAHVDHDTYVMAAAEISKALIAAR